MADVWAILLFLLGGVAAVVIVILAIQQRPDVGWRASAPGPERRRCCAFCGELVPVEAALCPSCHRQLGRGTA